MRPRSPYISTDPGAPVSAVAVPVRSMPRPSPMTQTPRTQTNDTAERGAHRAPEQQAHPDEELDQREERVPHRDVGRHEVPDVGDEVAEDEGLPAGVGQDVVLDEAPAEHEGLELQGRIEDPEQAEDDLEHPLGADGEREAAAPAPSGPSASLPCPVSSIVPCPVSTLPAIPPGCPVRPAGRPAAHGGTQASATAATSFCRVSLASPKSIVVLGS